MSLVSLAQKRCCPLRVAQIMVTPSVPWSSVKSKEVRGSGNQDVKGTKKGKWNESHHSMHC